MKTYKVMRNCWGFHGVYWLEGKVVDLSDDEVPPRHFELISSKEGEEVPQKPEPVKVENPNPRDVMAPRTYKIGQPIKTVGGFAAQHNFNAPKEVVTASQAFKRGRPKK